jgi:hypothetical protein
MRTRRPHDRDGEEKVIISLVISLGMIILAVLGWWLWNVLAPIGPALSDVTLVEMP